MAPQYDMEIAPKVRASRWLALQLDDPGGRHWPEAIRIFEKRIRARYLDPVSLLLRAERHAKHRWRFGFTILAIDCLLIETLQAFRLGLPDTKYKSKEMFRQFLTERSKFRQDFDPPKAEAFYDFVRCGILHQAEVRGGWRVWAVGPLVVPLPGGGIRINRTAFHERLVAEFEGYKRELAGETSAELRANLRTKMNHICTAT